jgi:hypothetical protein
MRASPPPSPPTAAGRSPELALQGSAAAARGEITAVSAKTLQLLPPFSAICLRTCTRQRDEAMYGERRKEHNNVRHGNAWAGN